jgi:hypothetical protein
MLHMDKLQGGGVYMHKGDTAFSACLHARCCYSFRLNNANVRIFCCAVTLYSW